MPPLLKKETRQFAIFLVICFVVFACICYFFANKNLTSNQEALITTLTKPATAQNTDETTLLFVGDIMLSRAIGNIMVKQKDWTYPFLKTADFLKSADLTFGNLENPIGTSGVKVGSIYSFRADPRTVEGLTSAGFDIVSIANNHIWDYGKEAFNETLKILDENAIRYTGGGTDFETAHTPVIFNVKGTRVAFLAYTNLLPSSLGKPTAKPAVAFPHPEQLKKYIMEATELADIVIVSFHWGDEYKTIHNRAQEDLAKTAIDAGANLIIGHHPHVVQEVVEYNGGFIAYSLGNFVFDQNFSTDTQNGLVVQAIVKDKKIVRLEKYPIRFNQTYQPYFPHIQ